MDLSIDYGKVETTDGMFEGVNTSRIERRTKSVAVTDLIDAQSKLLDYSKHIIESGESKDVSLRIIADERREAKRIEITWISEKQYIPVKHKK